ncbi:MAG: SAM-dependent methyltransferase [Gammaproteobacteria bacterium]|nr:SAM-dependent methyltransferase [Gammaproteobacteria bacterium]MDH5304436.1 SAM-dependent methyltransferase [Gammaproteobacteria bacterium]MDH5322214.1 SAM-dependent methyltransferase [Gammaproteobacteria bacterium]
MQQTQERSLPIPDADSAAHSDRVASHVRSLIGSSCISFAEYMHAVLYTPGLGYYAAGATKLGASGDFITAPEVSPLFARVLARQCATVMAKLSSASILEFGAGSGRLAADLLARLAELDALPHRYMIFEVSADLRERQQTMLASAIPEIFERVCWLDRLPVEHRGVVIANEVLDALPVERFVRRSDHVAQLCVALEQDRLVLVERPAPAILADAVAEIEHDLGFTLADGYVSEVCLAAEGWLADLAGLLHEGVALLFDYGVNRREYYAVDRDSGWLRCHFRHHVHANALALPGIQDITAWVDFSAVAAAAAAHGLNILGYVTQAHFLLDGGLREELAGFAELPLATQLQLSSQIKFLTLPGEMGENFKCLGLSRGPAGILDSLARANRANSL